MREKKLTVQIEIEENFEILEYSNNLQTGPTPPN